MRVSGTTSLLIIASVGMAACSGSGTALPPPSVTGAGGSDSNGGSSAVSSTSSQGGEVSNGGANPSGGNQTLGGSSPTGGKPSVGGGIITGGKTSGVGGNVVNTGGYANPAGGAPPGNGGAPPGNGGAATGGRVATGGSVTTGGTTTVTACTDTAPPNGDTCAHAVMYNWCGAPWMNGACANSCNMCGGPVSTGGAPSAGGGSPGSGGLPQTGGNGANGGSPPTGGTTSNGSTLPNVTGNTKAWGSRYWDCCKPACGWTGNSSNPIHSCGQSNSQLSDMSAKNACESGGSAYMCWSGIPRSISDNISYGFAAASGNNYKCGQCYQIQFDGGSHNGSASAGTTAIKSKQMIIQVINNGGVQADQFDLLIPGGGVGALNACATQWGTSDLGAQYGGFLAGCNGDATCVKNKCTTVFSGKPDLQAGCDWFLNWFHAADNPTFVYQTVTCPSDFKSKMGNL